MWILFINFNFWETSTQFDQKHECKNDIFKIY